MHVRFPCSKMFMKKATKRQRVHLQMNRATCRAFLRKRKSKEAGGHFSSARKTEQSKLCSDVGRVNNLDILKLPKLFIITKYL